MEAEATEGLGKMMTESTCSTDDFPIATRQTRRFLSFWMIE